MPKKRLTITIIMKPFDVYTLYDVNVVKGNACRTYDDQGIEYLDFYGGHAVISVGHAHPYYVQKLTEQLNAISFYSNSVINKLQWELAEKLGKLSGYEDYDLFLINSGAEANENALKLSSFYNNRRKVVSIQKAFHGRTAGAVRVTDNPKIIAPINNAFPVKYIEMDDIEALHKALVRKDVCAVIIEGIQGVGGINTPSDEFMQAIREECDKTNTVFIVDEVQSGYGRSGKFFAHQYSGVKPDLITTAKGMGNGFPIGGVLINPKFKPFKGELGTTFGGNHLACAAAIAVLDIMKAEKLVENAAKIGEYLMEKLRQFSQIKEVRGKGLMIGIVFDKPSKELREKLLYEQKVFTGAAGGDANVIRLLPPLCITKQDADLFLERLKNCLKEE